MNYSANLTFNTLNSTYQLDTVHKVMRRFAGTYDPLHDWHKEWFAYDTINIGGHNSVIVVPLDSEKIPFITSSIIGETNSLDVVTRSKGD